MAAPLRLEHFYQYAVSGADDMMFDGRRLWILADNKVHIIDYRDQDSTIDETIYLCQQVDNVHTYTSEYIHTLSGNGIEIKKIGVDTAAVFDGNDTIYIVDLTAGETSSITAPVPMNSNMEYSLNKLWFASYEIDNWQNVVYYYNLTTSNWTPVTMPVRHQCESLYVQSDFDNRILFTNFNNLSVSRFNAINGAYISTIRIEETGAGANREPYFIFTAQNKISYIVSLNDVISTLDATTGTVLHKHAGQGTVASMSEDSGAGTHFWHTASNKVYRTKLSDNDVIRDGSTADYEIATDNFPSTGFTKVLVPREYTYSAPGGYVTTDEIIFVLTNSHLIGFKPDEFLRRRTNEISINSRSMISKGPYKFTGGEGGADPDPLGTGCN